MGDIRTTTGQKLPETPAEKKSRSRRVFRNVVFIVTLITLAGCFIRIPKYAYANGYATTMGYAEVRSVAEGRVAEILFSSGDAVKAGDVLMRLDDKVQRTAYEEAKSRVAEAEAQVAYREVEVADATQRHENVLKGAEMDLAHAKDNLKLTRQLYEKSLASGRKLSDDEFAVRRSEEALRALREIDMTVGLKQLEVLRKSVEALHEATERARVALEQRTIVAPISGRLMRYTFYPGEMIRPDMVLYEIFDGEVNTMKLRLPERYAARVHEGCEVKAKLGTHKSVLIPRFPGKVAVMRPIVEGTGTGNYRVIYCSLDLRGEVIPPGTSVDAKVRIGRASLWMQLIEP